jgi:hypothetical protein
MNALKTSLGCLFIALMLRSGFMLAQGDLPWLQLNCHNPTSKPALTPKWTVIISSVQPKVRQIRNNRWEIEFIP